MNRLLNTFLKERGKEEVKGGRKRRRKQLLGEQREKRGYWKLKEGALDRTV
jgi:hypothetical protein